METQSFNLKTTEGRIAAINALETECMKQLIIIGVEVTGLSKLRLSDSSIVISVRISGEEGGEVTIYHNKTLFGKQKENTINFGCSGKFTPSNLFSYWRIICAASILKNWDAACAVVNEYCQKYVALVKEINNANPVLICENCKKYWIAPIEKCSCGSTTLTKTHPHNAAYAENKK